MRRGCVYLDEVAVLRLRDLVAGAGGKARLRRAGAATIVLSGSTGERHACLRLVERPAWRGGTRSYVACPSCSAAVRQVLVNPVTEELQCSRCWGPTKLRYRCQERHRLTSAGGVPEVARV